MCCRDDLAGRYRSAFAPFSPGLVTQRAAGQPARRGRRRPPSIEARCRFESAPADGGPGNVHECRRPRPAAAARRCSRTAAGRPAGRVPAEGGTAMDSLAQAVLAGEGAEQIAAEPVPPTYRAAYLKAADADLLSGCADKDVRRTVHVGDVPMPELAPDEVLVAVM